MKNFLSKRYNFTIYCVRGNHEARPQNVKDMHLIYDEDVGGEVYIQDKWPNIRYFKDWGIYTISGHKVAVIGGAYSVDKWYRLAQNFIWFTDEQLSFPEMLQAYKELKGQKVDFVFTHTCPLVWEPNDLFLSSIDQTKVDKSMERFLEFVAKDLQWSVWCFGHYHQDRLERPGVEQYFRDTESLETIWERWQRYKTTGELDWWLEKSPNFYKGLELENEKRISADEV